MKNSLYHLNDTLFALMEKLSDEDLTGEDLETEIKRARAINQTAASITANAGLILRANLEIANTEADGVDMPAMIKHPKAISAPVNPAKKNGH